MSPAIVSTKFIFSLLVMRLCGSHTRKKRARPNVSFSRRRCFIQGVGNYPLLLVFQSVEVFVQGTSAL